MAKANAVDYKKITLAFMLDYIEENAPQDKAWFKKVAYDLRPEKQKVFLFNSDGSPKMKVNKKGEKYQVSKMVSVEGSDVKPVFNLLKAKRAFCERYMSDILPKAKPKAPKATDRLKDW